MPIGLLLVSIVANLTDYYLHNVVEFLMSIYLGYGLDFMDIIIGMVWTFFDAAIAGFVIAWLYNKLAK
ncbi:hypothetical protein HUE58_01715 [Candidatus Ruthia endofausta]|uniref:Uncharacterized protein n=1 Tax=Candidatus Ruthia endofausta TaxID=2738852 RepID=A0A6N0HNL2_9GAMM|nr:hypothetical protein [Candidatus Ruthia endofausta]QKQ23916.1 hypothetical protein HUE58_01715 [Candidatus Ruthia endofausta]